MLFGSCISAFVWELVQDAPMHCIRLSSPRFALMLNRTFWLGSNSKICFTLRSSIWFAGVATVLGAVRGERTRLCMEGPQGLRQWLAGCF
jgi:hypothetical protein